MNIEAECIITCNGYNEEEATKKIIMGDWNTRTANAKSRGTRCVKQHGEEIRKRSGVKMRKGKASAMPEIRVEEDPNPSLEMTNVKGWQQNKVLFRIPAWTPCINKLCMSDYIQLPYTEI